MFFLLIRTRVYFVVACRYIKETRRHFTSQEGMFRSSARYYDDPLQPPYFHWLSSQVWTFIVVALLNAASASAFVAVDGLAGSRNVGEVVIPGAILVVLQLALMTGYLSSLEGKTSRQAVFESAPGGPRGAREDG